MNRKLSAALTFVILGASSLSALAQPQPAHRDRASHVQPAPYDNHRQPGPPQAGRDMRPAAPVHVAPHQAPRGNPPGHVEHRERRGAGPDHRWTEGSRVPPQFRTPHYVVKQWQRHGLKKPGRGQHWVQNGNDYLLLTQSGVVKQIVFGR